MFFLCVKFGHMCKSPHKQVSRHESGHLLTCVLSCAVQCTFNVRILHRWCFTALACPVEQCKPSGGVLHCEGETSHPRMTSPHNEQLNNQPRHRSLPPIEMRMHISHAVQMTPPMHYGHSICCARSMPHTSILVQNDACGMSVRNTRVWLTFFQTTVQERAGRGRSACLLSLQKGLSTEMQSVRSKKYIFAGVQCEKFHSRCASLVTVKVSQNTAGMIPSQRQHPLLLPIKCRQRQR